MATESFGVAPGDVDVSQLKIDKLEKGALGLPSLVLLSLASAAPLIGTTANVPLGIALGNGIGNAAGYIWVTIALLLFSVGYAAMGRELTAVGGFYSFISHGIGRPAGLAAGWSAILGYLLVEAALVGAVGYYGADMASTLFGINLSWVVYAFGAIVFVGLLAYFDIKYTAKVIGVALVIAMLMIPVIAITVLVKGGAHGVTLAPLNPLRAFSGIAPGIGLFFAFWGFLGFEVVLNYAEESKHPHRDGRIGLYLAVIIIGLAYVLMSWAGVVGHGLSAVTESASSDPLNFFYSLGVTYVGTWFVDAMKVFVVISSIACMLAFHQTTSRYFYAMGREGILPKALGRTHPKWQSPYVACVVQTILVAGVTLAFIIFWYASKSAQEFSGTFANAPFYELFGWMAIATTFFVLANQVLCSLATILYFRKPHMVGKGNWWTTGVAPALGGVAILGAFCLLIVNLTSVGGNVIWVKIIPVVCIVWFAIGLALAYWLRSRKPERYQVLGRMVNRAMDIGSGAPANEESDI